MIYLILVIIALITIIAIMVYFKFGNSKEQALKVDKRILENQLKERELELGIAIKHASLSRERTIKSKKDLADAKKEVFKKYNYTDINSAMAYINGPE